MTKNTPEGLFQEQQPKSLLQERTATSSESKERPSHSASGTQKPRSKGKINQLLTSVMSDVPPATLAQAQQDLNAWLSRYKFQPRMQHKLLAVAQSEVMANWLLGKVGS